MNRKIIWMQLLLIGILSSFLSCAQVDRPYIQEYNFINKTDYTIGIEAFNRIDSIYYKSTYTIPKDSSLFQEFEFTFGNKRGIIALSDSVSVIFGNTKILSFLLNTESPFNIINGNNYDFIELGKNHHKFTYIFNDEMYNAATPLK